MVARNEIYWASLDEPLGRRPVCVLTRSAVAPVMASLTVAPITRTIRGIASEVEIGTSEGLPERCAINCDGVITFAASRLDAVPVGELDAIKQAEVDAALRYALSIEF